MKNLFLASLSVGVLFLASGCSSMYKGHHNGDCCGGGASASECKMKGDSCGMKKESCAMKDGKCEHGKECTLKDGKCDGCSECQTKK